MIQIIQAGISVHSPCETSPGRRLKIGEVGLPEVVVKTKAIRDREENR